MWSEHCSYKSSKVHLRQFAEKAPRSDALLAGIGANAGVVDIGGGYAVTFKIESHNHPSFVEPHQGAVNGVGGIVRDILAIGARPVAVMDALRFGPAGAGDTRRVLSGVVSGISSTATAGPAQHRRGAGLRRLLRGKSARQRAVRRGDAARGPQACHCRRARQPGRPARLEDRARRHRRCVGPGQRDLRRDGGHAAKRPSVQVATRSWKSS